MSKTKLRPCPFCGKRKPNPPKPIKVRTFRCPDQLWESIVLSAYALDMRMSAYIRRAVENQIAADNDKEES